MRLVILPGVNEVAEWTANYIVKVGRNMAFLIIVDINNIWWTSSYNIHVVVF